MKKYTRRIIIVTIFLAIAAINGYCTDYYLNGQFFGVGGLITINGIPIGTHFNDRQSHSVSECVSNLLKNGENDIEIDYVPNSSTDEGSKLIWTLKSIANGGDINSDQAIKIDGGEIGSRKLYWSDLSQQDFVVCRGSFDEKKVIHFVKQGDKVSWGGILSKSHAFTRLPTQIHYAFLSQQLSKIKLHFMKSGTPIDVIYSIPTFSTHSDAINLKSDMITSGGQWADQSGFDEILIEGVIVSPLTLYSSSLLPRFGL